MDGRDNDRRGNHEDCHRSGLYNHRNPAPSFWPTVPFRMKELSPMRAPADEWRTDGAKAVLNNLGLSRYSKQHNNYQLG